jgi:hypothetical protein
MENAVPVKSEGEKSARYPSSSRDAKRRGCYRIVTEFEKEHSAKKGGRAGTLYPSDFPSDMAPKTVRCDEAGRLAVSGAVAVAEGEVQGVVHASFVLVDEEDTLTHSMESGNVTERCLGTTLAAGFGR